MLTQKQDETRRPLAFHCHKVVQEGQQPTSKATENEFVMKNGNGIRSSIEIESRIVIDNDSEIEIECGNKIEIVSGIDITITSESGTD
ncbi:hypothetical protein EVAR_70371_1 [Eumeta japonica]|uniref:Uncharacterized protein n=1 Tax=Eumeta variegata TaxID=151549 RepID=A0A4C1SIJ5_EUMVA|nr:hypothetical protein EVAR_70371_1 [Eumeta japonica]